MLDPIGGFQRIEEFFTSYVETSFRISDPAVAAARRELLGRADIFATIAVRRARAEVPVATTQRSKS